MKTLAQDALLTHLQKHHIRELENIMADIATLTAKPVTITWNCGLGSIIITTEKAQEILNEHPKTLEQAADKMESKHTEVWVEGRTIFEQKGGPAIVETIKQFVEKGERCMQQAVEDQNPGNYTFWDGFHNCAENILREVEEPQTVEPSAATCTTCVFYENNCPFVRGKFVPYPSRVCKDYTCTAHTDVLQNK